MLELRCRDVNECNFTAKGHLPEEVINAWADHAAERHGMKYIPPKFNSQIQKRVRTIQPEQRLELSCRDVTDCDFVAEGETPEQILEACAGHGSKEHGLMSFPPQWYIQMWRHIKPVQS